MSKNEWIDIDVAKYLQAKKLEIDGVPVESYISPQKLPTAIRTKVEDNKLWVEFKYLDSGERLKEFHSEDEVSILYGKNSKRIFAITIDLEKIFEKVSQDHRVLSSVKGPTLGHMRRLRKSHGSFFSNFPTVAGIFADQRKSIFTNTAVAQ